MAITITIEDAAQLNQCLDDVAWTRYHMLIDKRHAETMTPEEQQELIALSDQIEAINVQRMTYLIELAQLRHTTPDVLIRQ